MTKSNIVEGAGCIKPSYRALEELGLGFRQADLRLTDEQSELLITRTEFLRNRVSIDIPVDPGKWLLIEELRHAPDAGGWIVRHEKVNVPYWILKSDVPLLSELEYFLDDVRLPR